jgi:hypothetical protein
MLETTKLTLVVTVGEEESALVVWKNERNQIKVKIYTKVF